MYLFAYISTYYSSSLFMGVFSSEVTKTGYMLSSGVYNLQYGDTQKLHTHFTPHGACRF